MSNEEHHIYYELLFGNDVEENGRDIFLDMRLTSA